MFAWIADNVVTIVAIAAVLGLIGFAVFSLVKDKKRGSCSCGGNCAACGMCSCRNKKES